ncbi:MAG: tetratricopeptide repeat protein [Treponema sp.]|nr:tetratricopeptide repeat protein [Treponema sp.]
MAKTILSEGISLYRHGDYSGAITYFLSLPDDAETDNIELAYYIGLCYAKLERYDDALLYLEQVVTAGQDIDRVLQCRYLLAVIYVMSGRKRLADFELNKLLETGYKPASVYASLAFIAWEQGDTDKCIDYYRRSLDADEDNTTALNGLGYVLASEDKDLTSALSYCKRALEKAPQSAAVLDSIGFVYMKLGLKNDSLKYLKQAQAILPDNEEIAEHIRVAQVG